MKDEDQDEDRQAAMNAACEEHLADEATAGAREVSSSMIKTVC